MSDFYHQKVYWEIEGNHFHNKLRALRHLKSKGLGLESLRFRLFDEAFSAVDWTQEPAESLDALMLKRARQLRHSYDYLRIWYSGGADSHTFLKVFVDNDIQMDEILVYRCNPVSRFNDIDNSEVNDIALPYLREIADQLPHTKIRILDVGTDAYLRFYQDGWLENFNVSRFRPYSRASLYHLFPDLAEPAERGFKHCDVIGKDKPRLTFVDGKYYSTIWDGAFASVVGDPFVEYFFITDALPQLHVKQCHIVKRWHKENRGACPNIDWLFKQDGYATVDRICRYPLWRPLTLQKKGEINSPKAETALHWAAQNAPTLHQRYLANLESVEQELGMFCNSGRIQNDFIGIRSQEHCMGS